MERKLAIVETSQISSAELKRLCAEIIPDVKVCEFIDDTLLAEVVANGSPTPAVRRRMLNYYHHAQLVGADVILNQCSSVSEVAETIKPFIDVPIIKIDEAMARKAVSIGSRIAVIATVASTVGPSVRLVESMAREAGKQVQIEQRLVDGAMMVLLQTGDREKHNAMIVGDVEEAAKHNDVIVLAQGSMTVLEPSLKHISKPVLTSPRLGIEYVREVLQKLR